MVCLYQLPATSMFTMTNLLTTLVINEPYIVHRQVA